MEKDDDGNEMIKRLYNDYYIYGQGKFLMNYAIVCLGFLGAGACCCTSSILCFIGLG